ncbi:MAG: hypothetical protein ACYSO4_00840, partial [Planctomycetota bacterium]
IRHFHFSIIFNAGLGLLASLLKSGGFALFLLALLQRLKNPVANTTPLIALAGILVLLGTLISMGMSMMHIGMLYKHFPFARFLLHAATTGFYFLAGAGMGMLILTQISGRSLAKPLAAVTLLVTIILGGLIFISYGTNAGIFRSIGSAAMSFGYLANVVRLSGNPRSRTAVPAGLAKAKTIAAGGRCHRSLSGTDPDAGRRSPAGTGIILNR